MNGRKEREGVGRKKRWVAVVGGRKEEAGVFGFFFACVEKRKGVGVSRRRAAEPAFGAPAQSSKQLQGNKYCWGGNTKQE